MSGKRNMPSVYAHKYMHMEFLLSHEEDLNYMFCKKKKWMELGGFM